MGTSSTKDDDEVVAEAVLDPKKHLPPPEFTELITGVKEASTIWQSTLFDQFHSFAISKRKDRYVEFICRMTLLKHTYEGIPTDKTRKLMISYEKQLNRMYNEFIAESGVQYLDFGDSSIPEDIKKVGRAGWKDTRGFFMKPSQIWDPAEQYVIEHHLSSVYWCEFIHSREYKQWLKTESGDEYKKWLKTDDGKKRFESRAEKFSRATLEPPRIKFILEGLDQNAEWADDLLSKLHTFMDVYPIVSMSEYTQFIRDYSNLKKWYYKWMSRTIRGKKTPKEWQKIQKEYVQKLNMMYGYYVMGVPVNLVINFDSRNAMRILRERKTSDWLDRDRKLFRPDEIWGAHDSLLTDVIYNLEHNADYKHFKESHDYNEWQKHYGVQYMHWLEGHHPISSAASCTISAMSSAATSSATAHIDYFNDMMDYEGIYEYLPRNQLVDYEYDHDRNVYDMNVELIVLMAIIMVCVAGIVCLCLAMIGMFNVFVGYQYHIKTRPTKQDGFSSYSDEI